MVQQETIYIPLLNEGTAVWRPAIGEHIRDSLYRVLATKGYDPEVEDWKFLPGSIVRCEKQVLMEGSTPHETLVAVEAVQHD